MILALILALVIMEFALPLFNELTGKNFTLDLVQSKQSILMLGSLFIATLFMAGVSPALFFADMNPVLTIKSKHYATGKPILRYIIITTQFFFAAFLIASTVVVINQFNYIHNKDLGYNKENLAYIKLDEISKPKMQQLKQELGKVPGITAIGSSSDLLACNRATTGGANWPGKDPDLWFRTGFIAIDEQFIETSGLHLIEGRNFDQSSPADQHNFIINEELAKRMETTDIIGHSFQAMGVEGSVVGVVKNYNFQPLKNKISPMYFYLNNDHLNYLYFRLDSHNHRNTINLVNTKWNKLLPDSQCNIKFLSDSYEFYYREELKSAKIIQLFAGLAIIISCLGLIGISGYLSSLKTKEIGIRKILGASLASINKTMIFNYLRWVLIANVLAIPVTYFFMRKWLSSFSYHVNITPSIFLITLFLTTAFAITAVGFQILRFTRINPTKAIKNE